MAENELLQLARERAEKRLDAAIAQIRLGIVKAAKDHQIPEGVLGHDTVDLLGRIMFQVALSRDLRREAGQLMAKQELEAMGRSTPAPPAPAPEDQASTTAVDALIPTSLAIAELQGITVAQCKALQAAGINQVGDLINVPDEHLEKITKLDAKAIGKVRAAVAKASAPK
jgi:hypothetical protein